jgi:hypothetical protein
MESFVDCWRVLVISVDLLTEELNLWVVTNVHNNNYYYQNCTSCEILKWMKNGRVLYLLHYVCKEYKILTGRAIY